MRFRPGTVDQDCWNGIVHGNEYRLPDDMKGWKCIDIGTHVGSFCQAAHDRGAALVVSFEASKDNYRVALQNVERLKGVTLMHTAVGRCDERFHDKVYFSGYIPFIDGRVNTGGGDVFAGEEGEFVPCLRFDGILPGEHIDLLKIDCEGSEWPILYTSDLSRIDRIVGEYHSLKSEVERDLWLPRRCHEDELAVFLREQGFKDVNVLPYSREHAAVHGGQRIGLFFASR